MFNDFLIYLDNKLVSIDVSNTRLVKDRLHKINCVYFYDLILSKHIVEINGQKSLLRKELIKQ